MKQEKRGKDIYLQLEFDDFGGTNWNNEPGGVFAYIDGSGNVTKEKGKDGVRFWVTWQKPHGPEEIRTLKTGGSVYLELPEDVCAEVDRYRKESHEKNAEMQFLRYRDRFKNKCKGMTDAEITIQEEKELALVNFLLEPDKHPEPMFHEFKNTPMPKVLAEKYAALFSKGRVYFWKRYRHKAECEGNKPPGNEHENDILPAEGFIRYRDYLKKRLSEPEAPAENATPVNMALKDLFEVKNWQEYMDLLTNCNKPILKKEGETYTFTGNKKTERGVVAAFIKFLKLKGIVNPNHNRDQLAEVLSCQIKDFQISGATIDNQSTKFIKHYQTKLETDVNDLINKVKKGK